MAKIDTLFMTKTAEKPYPLGLHILYSPYKGAPPSPRQFAGISECLLNATKVNLTIT